MTNAAKSVNEKSKGEIMMIKRKITEAGRLMQKIAPDLKQLEQLKKEIKEFELDMVAGPESTVVLVSGEFVAELGAEKQEHVVGEKANLALFGELGLETFMKICTFPISDMQKAVGEHMFNAICPKRWSGKGRVFSLKPKS